jgi:hypothetical protein
MRTHAAKRQMRIYSKFRFAIFLIVLTVTAFVMGGFLFGAEASGTAEPEFETVLIHAGDTVWGIADEYGSGDEDIRTYVKTICELNGIDQGMIYPGQTIRVPIREIA